MSSERTLHVMEHGEVFMANERQWVRETRRVSGLMVEIHGHGAVKLCVCSQNDLT